MRRATTLIEVFIIIAIVAIIIAIAIPNFLTAGKFKAGSQVRVKHSQIIVTLMRHPSQGDTIDFKQWICRIDNGPNTVPRFSEVTFTTDELEQVTPNVEK